MTDLHDLGRLCRVCGERLTKARSKSVVYSCAEYKQQLLATFQIDISDDRTEIHPSMFCNRCYSATKRHTTAAASGLPYKHSIVVFLWEEHKETGCSVSTIVTFKDNGTLNLILHVSGLPTS